jgi:hypothetical protein
MTFSLALTQGFHNAPRLYGDETVRRPPRVTGFHSGLRAGRDELVYGVMDGVTGIVTQPIRGAKQKGVVGAAKGVGFGLGGFVLKDIAALIGPGAYLMKGLDAEYMKRYQPTGYLRRARIAQGQKELQLIETQSADVERNIATRWQALERAMSESKSHHKSGLMGSLLGMGDKKEGQRVPRKSKDEDRDRPRDMVPHAKTEKQVTREKQSMDREGAKMRLDGANRGLNRSSTAPITTLEHRGTGAMKPLERPRHDETMVGNVHLAGAGAGLRSGSGEDVNTAHLGVESSEAGGGAMRTPSMGTGSEDTRVESEGVGMDWANIRKQAEGVEGGMVLELGAAR